MASWKQAGRKLEAGRDMRAGKLDRGAGSGSWTAVGELENFASAAGEELESYTQAGKPWQAGTKICELEKFYRSWKILSSC